MGEIIFFYTRSYEFILGVIKQLFLTHQHERFFGAEVVYE